ncbi:GNAT family N-acetyltransferase [Solilutibacter silvestris]|uniref:GNAT family N-acetyltransferase n=1 Tax=Solilutibacter silvestris TaxID=1645665 RepID=UPI003D339BAF
MPALQARILESLDAIPAGRWDALHSSDHPFVRHAFLSALERTGCLRADWGWAPHHLTLWDEETLVAAAPMYLKSNSHGEFVFDFAWAHAYAQHGLEYYPKWLCGAPYSPVTGPRLLAQTPELRQALANAMTKLCSAQELSSVHVNFHPKDEDSGFGEDWLLREDIQYHWNNRDGWKTFDDYLAAMDAKHRKNIRQERAKVERAGVTFRVVHGDEASDADLAAIHGFYLQTFAEYGNSPALTLEFLREIARTMPRQLVLFIAEVDGEAIAGALCLRGGDTLYGRYWGSHAQLPGLHFETCYYQGIDYCLRHGLTRFEPGAQGEHKIARGFLPTLVRSRHWIADPRFRGALDDWCAAERRDVRRHAARLHRHSPFRDGDIRS